MVARSTEPSGMNTVYFTVGTLLEERINQSVNQLELGTVTLAYIRGLADLIEIMVASNGIFSMLWSATWTR